LRTVSNRSAVDTSQGADDHHEGEQDQRHADQRRDKRSAQPEAARSHAEARCEFLAFRGLLAKALEKTLRAEQQQIKRSEHRSGHDHPQ
jgi:hypothetical protein